MGVALRGVTRRYPGLTALDEVDLEIEDGTAVALTGPSGAGKSTVLHLVGGMDQPDSGTIEIDGEKLTARQLDAHRRRIGFVFQRFHLLPALTVLDNVLAPVLPRRVGFDRRARATELLDAVGLTGRADALPSELSGGQQQRVAVARALINRPGLLLADEPTGNLDSVIGREIIDLLLSLRERYGMTMLVATHDSEVAASCDRIVRLQDGRIIADERITPADDVLDRLGGLRP
ncbi:putative ABC transport system ATP-binding protein [Streptomyces sp. DvalAA-14]|uniref:ABC transporter ATP-binding protein n=1 Tax=unclassified Streptomyces TaxID=2593676 RepID=UPI00081AFE58|nr:MULTISPECIES: ABC transporter ATP-binding protein [unclassified Streptomyces]MYS18695.1 ATP-binding cassette domain-containing protein [Streptomyces sp. SID4948]SCD27770.1 putative ABC transport system ATP-binding protein [Streptomyces sp. DvalAA-14]